MTQKRIELTPIDSVTVTTLVDNYVDINMFDEGLAKRVGLPTPKTPHTPAPLFEEGKVEMSRWPSTASQQCSQFVLVAVNGAYCLMQACRQGAW